jgi:hypothetical protein
VTVLRRIFGLQPKPVPPPPQVVELREATQAAILARRLARNRRPTGNRYADALAGYERPDQHTEARRELAD